MKLIKTLLHTALLIAATNMAAFSQTYNWSAVRVGGGGRVPSIKAHPKVAQPFLYYYRRRYPVPLEQWGAPVGSHDAWQSHSNYLLELAE